MSAECAALAAVSLFLTTIATVCAVSRYDDGFIDRSSRLWNTYAISAVASYMCGMAMSFLRTDIMFVATSVISFFALCLLLLWATKKESAKSDENQLLLPEEGAALDDCLATK